MKDVCILFAYHRDDRTTWHNYELLRRNNPDVDVYPLVFSCLARPCLPHTMVYRDTCKILVEEPGWLWANLDLLLYDFFVHRPQSYQRYVFMEWDALCNIDVRELYRAEWDRDLVGKHCRQYTTCADGWWWFHALDPQTVFYLTPERVTGIAPLCGALLSARCLQYATENVLLHYEAFREVFSEVRLPTAAALHGIRATTARRLLETPTFDCFESRYQDWMVHEPGIHHGIKMIP